MRFSVLGLQYDPYICIPLINMYIKCGSICSASLVFDKISEREDNLHDSMELDNRWVLSVWPYGCTDDGFVQFRRMQSLGVRPDAYSISIVLRTDFFDLLRGKEIHGYLLKNIYHHDHFLDSALIDMYTKCGRIVEGRNVFDSLVDKSNTVTWNSIISGFHRNGLWYKSLEYFVLMKSRGCKLESSAFSIVLTACSDGEDVVFGSELLKLQPARGSNYIQLLNLYREGELWDKAANLRMRMKEKGLRKNPGSSWIETKEKVDVFHSGDSSSLWTSEIYETLSDLSRRTIAVQNSHIDLFAVQLHQVKALLHQLVFGVVHVFGNTLSTRR